MPRGRFDSSKVKFEVRDDGTVVAYRPNEVLVRLDEDPDRIAGAYQAVGLAPRTRDEGGQAVLQRRINAEWGVLTLEGSQEPRDALESLRLARVEAQLNHVYFVGALDASAQFNPNYAAPNYAAPNYAAPNYAAPNYAAPNYAAPNYAAPNYAAPNYAAPNYAAPNYAAPNYAAPHLFLNCRCEPCEDPNDGPPLIPEMTARTASPPLWEMSSNWDERNELERQLEGLDPDGAPAVRIQRQIAGLGSADLQIHVLDVRPQTPMGAQRPDENAVDDDKAQFWGNEVTVRNRVLQRDGALLPESLFLVDEFQNPTNSFAEIKSAYLEEPNSPQYGADVNGDGFLDPTTNHMVFIKGIIDRIVRPEDGESYVTMHSVAGTMGEVDDASLVKAMQEVDRVHGPNGELAPADAAERRRSLRIMSLSLSGYPDEDMQTDVLAAEVERLQAEGWLIVASAGNNANCRPARPAALDGVVSVGAYGPCGPAWFSNYGAWVDACGPGVSIVSNFPTVGPNGLTVDGVLSADGFDTGYATWSGTSFSAPFVAAMIARWILRRRTSTQRSATAFENAKNALILAPTAPRIPSLGTVVSTDLVSIQTTVDIEAV